MNLNEYQMGARDTDELSVTGTAKDIPMQQIRLAAGVSDEAGEVLGKYKKGMRGSDEELDREEVLDELGDVLWYVARLTDALDAELEDVARANLAKLGDRKHRGVLAGSGDKR